MKLDYPSDDEVFGPRVGDKVLFPDGRAAVVTCLLFEHGEYGPLSGVIVRMAAQHGGQAFRMRLSEKQIFNWSQPTSH